MYTELRVDDAGLLRAQAALQRLHLAGATVHETVFPAIVHDFHRMEERRFQRQGPGWEPLSPTTLALRQRKGITHERILEETGELRGVLTGTREGLQVHHDPDVLTIAVPVHYAEFHHIGPRTIKVFGRGSAILPQRKLWEIQHTDAMRWSRIVKRGLIRTGPMGDFVMLDEIL